MKLVKTLIQIVSIWAFLFLWNSNADTWSGWDLFFAFALGASIAGGAEVVYRALKSPNNPCYWGGECKNDCKTVCTNKPY